MSILITGANRGVGLALARHYSAAGKNVIATTRQAPSPDLAGSVDWQTLDVTQQPSFDDLGVRLDGCAISLLICNAGVLMDRGENLSGGYAPVLWEATFKANVLGPFLTIQNLLPNLQVGKAGKIAIIASGMGSNAAAGGDTYIYRASKAAAINLASNLAVDLAPLGIAVGAYHPGWVQTDMGGAAAAITPDQSASGLIARFGELDTQTTGCFRAYDGTDLQY